MYFTVNRILLTLLLLSMFVFGFACKQKSAGAQSPTEAYQNLYKAVKAKDTEGIKAAMSKSTLALVEIQAKNQKQTLEQTLANGFTATTFSPVMPEIRDERVKDNMGAVEVWNSKESKWDDLPFINEDGWKLADGEAWGGKYKSPGKGRAQLESEANPNSNKMIMMNVNANLSPMNNSNSGAADKANADKTGK